MPATPRPWLARGRAPWPYDALCATREDLRDELRRDGAARPRVLVVAPSWHCAAALRGLDFEAAHLAARHAARLVRVPAEGARDLLVHFGVAVVPCMVVLAPDGARLDRADLALRDGAWECVTRRALLHRAIAALAPARARA